MDLFFSLLIILLRINCVTLIKLFKFVMGYDFFIRVIGIVVVVYKVFW